MKPLILCNDCAKEMACVFQVDLTEETHTIINPKCKDSIKFLKRKAKKEMVCSICNKHLDIEDNLVAAFMWTEHYGIPY